MRASGTDTGPPTTWSSTEPLASAISFTAFFTSEGVNVWDTSNIGAS